MGCSKHIMSCVCVGGERVRVGGSSSKQGNLCFSSDILNFQPLPNIQLTSRLVEDDPGGNAIGVAIAAMVLDEALSCRSGGCDAIVHHCARPTPTATTGEESTSVGLSAVDQPSFHNGG